MLRSLKEHCGKPVPAPKSAQGHSKCRTIQVNRSTAAEAAASRLRSLQLNVKASDRAALNCCGSALCSLRNKHTCSATRTTNMQCRSTALYSTSCLDSTPHQNLCQRCTTQIRTCCVRLRTVSLVHHWLCSCQQPRRLACSKESTSACLLQPSTTTNHHKQRCRQSQDKQVTRPNQH